MEERSIVYWENRRKVTVASVQRKKRKWKECEDKEVTGNRSWRALQGHVQDFDICSRCHRTR